MGNPLYKAPEIIGPEWVIYGITDPSKENRIRYIGYTSGKYDRMKFHFQVAAHKRTRKDKWLCSLRERGFVPEMIILERGSGSWQDRETFWIRKYREDGHDLVNATDGGEGVRGFSLSKEQRSLMRLKQMMRVFPQDCVAKLEPNGVHPGKIVQCDNCGAEHFARISKRHKFNYCSRECFNIHKVGRLSEIAGKRLISGGELSIYDGRQRNRATMRNCNMCGVEYLAKLSVVNGRSGRGKYCSRKCSALGCAQKRRRSNKHDNAASA